MSSAIKEAWLGSNTTPSQSDHHLDSQRTIERREQLKRLRNVLEPLYWEAVRVRELARSWRGFHVGSAVYAFKADATIREERWRTFSGMNIKIRENTPKICAETIAISAAYAAGYTEIIGMMVVAEPQLDEDSGLLARTLHPCHPCRMFLKEHPIVPRYTRIITALPPEVSRSQEEPWYEFQTLNQILRLHGES